MQLLPELDSNQFQFCHKESISTQPWGGVANQWPYDYLWRAEIRTLCVGFLL
jgi:hypothetical protein